MVRYRTTSKDVLVADIVAIQDWEGFDSLASYLETEHAARPLEQLDGPESRVWKFEIDGTVIALHNNPDGNYFKAIGKESHRVLKVVIEDLERRLSGTEIASPTSNPQRVLMPHALFGEWNLLDQYPDPILANLITRYSEPSRHYHTLAHVRALLSHLSRHQALANDLPAITAAILYHDAVYDTRRNDNEARSAELASHDLSALGWPRAGTDKVVAMILATQHHNPSQPDGDTWLFLDLDLSILGAQAEHYAAYSAAVRREFEWVPENAYKQGRSRVLTGFLARETIFRTPALITLWEENARTNLTNELSALAADAQR